MPAIVLLILNGFLMDGVIVATIMLIVMMVATVVKKLVLMLPMNAV